MRRRLQGKQRPPQTAWWLDAAFKVTEEDAPKKKSVYLVTISRQRVHYTASSHPLVGLDGAPTKFNAPLGKLTVALKISWEPAQ